MGRGALRGEGLPSKGTRRLARSRPPPTPLGVSLLREALSAQRALDLRRSIDDAISPAFPGSSVGRAIGCEVRSLTGKPVSEQAGEFREA